jgi:hypothetical protein
MPDRRHQMQKRIAAELTQIAQLGPMLKGTVCEVKRGPRKRGAGERTTYLLTYKGKGNKTRSVYVPAQRLAQARDLIARHRAAVRALDRVVELSVALFRAKPEHASEGRQNRLA